jgi:hypothetical protein
MIFVVNIVIIDLVNSKILSHDAIKKEDISISNFIMLLTMS